MPEELRLESGVVRSSVTTLACRQVWSLAADLFHEATYGLPVSLRRPGCYDLRARRSEARLELNRSMMSREQMERRSVREILDRFFSGSARSLVSHLLGSERLSAEDVKVVRCEADGEEWQAWRSR